MSVDSVVVSGDLVIGFRSFSGVQAVIANALDDWKNGDQIISEFNADLITDIYDKSDLVGVSTLSGFGLPPGITHTIHTVDFDFNDRSVTVNLYKPKVDDGKTALGDKIVSFGIEAFLKRHGF